MDNLQQALLSSLSAVGNPARIMLAYSGGLDSSVLLNLLVQLRDCATEEPAFSLRALHVNHQLNPASKRWQTFCRQQCRQQKVRFLTQSVCIESCSGESLENLARKARYEVFASHLQAGEFLLMAHHLDDQIETIFFRLMRAAGPRGLAGIPATRFLAGGSILRPLLAIERQQLKDYALAQQLEWVEDDSNTELRFDRNYCRHEILPAIEKRWPGFRSNWMKSARLCGEADELLEELAELDYQKVRGEKFSMLQVEPLLGLSVARQKNVLRYWIRHCAVPLPSGNKLLKIVNETLLAHPQGQPEVSWEGYELRRFKQCLYLFKTLPELDGRESFHWDLGNALLLGTNGRLVSKQVRGGGLKLPSDSRVSVRYRQGGEQCKLVNRPTKRLKKLLQEEGIPPWLRNRIPLLYLDEKLVCIPGIGICEGFCASANQSGRQISWQPPDPD